MVVMPLFQREMWEGFAMNEDHFLRLVHSFESIAESLQQITGFQKRMCDHDYPERKEPREAIVTRIKTEDDLARERQGASDEPLGQWFGGFEDEGFVGVREKAFLEEKRRNEASVPVQPEQRPDEGSVEAAGNKTRRRGKRSSDHPPA